MTDRETIYEAIGGEDTVQKIVDILYANIAKDAYLFEIFPDDLTDVAHRQKLFLMHFLGGPSYYLMERGHPMLKRRHLEFLIDERRREGWLACMKIALAEANVPEPYRTDIFDRLTNVAKHMQNIFDE